MGLGPMGSGKSNKKTAQKRERDLAEYLGGEATPNSGATPSKPGDVHLPDFLLDDKFTGKLSYSVTIKDINKLCREARSLSKQPALIIHFTNEEMSMMNEKTWALIPLKTAKEMGYFDGDG